MVGETEVKERPKSNPDYLMQLMNDRKVMSSLPNFSGIFTHLERLLDEGKELASQPTHTHTHLTGNECTFIFNCKTLEFLSVSQNDHCH